MSSQKSNLPKLSEKGLLTPDNCVVALIDFQPQMLLGTSSHDRQSIINNTLILAKAARIFGVPVVLSSVETKSFSGNTVPQVLAAVGQTPVERSSMNSWDDKNFVAAIQATGRKKIVLAGLWTETCVALPTIQAIHDGYEVYVVEDCCGDINLLSHENAMKRDLAAFLGASRAVCRRVRARVVQADPPRHGPAVALPRARSAQRGAALAGSDPGA